MRGVLFLSSPLVLAEAAVLRVLEDPVEVACDAGVYSGVSGPRAPVAPRNHPDLLVFLVTALGDEGTAAVTLKTTVNQIRRLHNSKMRKSLTDNHRAITRDPCHDSRVIPRRTYLAGVTLPVGVPGAQHVVRYHTRAVAGVTTVLKTHHRNLHLLEETGRLALLVQCSPARGHGLRPDVIVI